MKHSTKTKLMVFITGILVCMLLVSFAACKISEESDETNDYFKEYNMYLVYAASEDITPLDYETWLATVKGEKGDKGDKGEDGKDGANGKSAYEIWLENGHTGSQTDFLEWLKGEKGDKGEAGKDGTNGTDGKDGASGKSAFEIFKEYYPDYKGTEKEWVTDIAKGEICALFGHSESDWIIDKQPTGTYPGSKHKECTVCKKVLETIEIPMIGEGLTYEINADGQTCTVTGVDSAVDKIVIPDKSPDGYAVTAIGNSAFENCSASSIEIPDSIKKIGNRAFYGCVNFTEIHIPSSVTQIGTQIFEQASNLTTVYYDASYGSKDNQFLAVSNIKKVVFGGSKIPDYVTFKASNLTDVEILGNVTAVGSFSFSVCTRLANIYIEDMTAWCKVAGPENLMKCGKEEKNLYLNNELVTDLVIPNGIKSIGEYSFAYCTGLTSVTVPDSLVSIGDYAFSGCVNIENIYITDLTA